jgi:hypothetical protein
MHPELLSVTTAQTLQFFYEHLKDVAEHDDAPPNELLYNASVLAHFATTSVHSASVFPASPSNLSAVFDLYVLDRNQVHDPDLLEAAASQCLLMTGFFQEQQRRRYNVEWYAALGAGFFFEAARAGNDASRSRMMRTMALRFDYWRRQQCRLAHELRDLPRLVG